MALQEIHFSFKTEGPFVTIPKAWSHTGIVGSGDLEILMRYEENQGQTRVKIVTPVKGFDSIWKKVLEKFVKETRLGNVMIEINDNNAVPFIASLRLKQALIEAKGEDEG